MKITDTPIHNRDMGDLIWDERGRQIEKWGAQTHTLAEYLTILTEEVGEAAQKICNLTWNPAKDEVEKAQKRGDLNKLRDELSQVAAVAVAMMTGIQEELNKDG